MSTSGRPSANGWCSLEFVDASCEQVSNGCAMKNIFNTPVIFVVFACLTAFASSEVTASSFQAATTANKSGDFATALYESKIIPRDRGGLPQKLYWIDNERVLFAGFLGPAPTDPLAYDLMDWSKRKAGLYVWSLNQPASIYYKIGGVPGITYCADNGFVRFNGGYNLLPDGSSREGEMYGLTGQEKFVDTELENIERYPDLKQDHIEQYGHLRNLKGMRSVGRNLQCKYSFKIEMQGRNWTALLPAHGYIELTSARSRNDEKRKRSFVLYSPKDPKGIELPIPAREVSLQCRRYHSFLGAYLFSRKFSFGCNGPMHPSFKTTRTPYWIVWPDGGTERNSIPTGYWSEGIDFLTLTRKGLFFTSRKSTGSAAYLFNDGQVQRLFKGIVLYPETSPDGCKVAFSYADPSTSETRRDSLQPFQARVIDLCAGQKTIADNRATALREPKPLVKRGDARSQYKRGLRYYLGRGIQRDYAQAALWFRKAAEQSHAGAQFHLGVLYEQGRGIEQDYAQAVRWYRSAAEQGHVRAQSNLGSMYSWGRGVPKDKAEAQFWSSKAQAQRVRQKQARATKRARDKKISAKLSTITPDEFKKLMSTSIRNSSRQLGMRALTKAPDETFSSSVPWLKEHAAQFAPEFLYMLAMRSLKIDPDRAVFWWLVGRLRLVYDVVRCKDKTARSIVGAMDRQFRVMVGKMNLTSLKTSSDKLQAALDWDINNPPHKFPLLPTCLHGLDAMGLALKQSGLGKQRPFAGKSVGKHLPGHVGKTIILPTPKMGDQSQWLKPVSEHRRLLKETRDSYRRSIAKGQKRR